MDSIILWNEKLQKKMLGTKINNDETEMITKYNIKHNKTGNSIIHFPFIITLGLLEESVQILRTLWTTLKVFSETSCMKNWET